MRHPDDGNLAALDDHLLEVEQGEKRAEEWQNALNDVIDNHWGEVVTELGNDTVNDVLYGVYMDCMGQHYIKTLTQFIDAAIERVAERISK